VLLYVLEQPSVDNPSEGLLKRGTQLGAISPLFVDCIIRPEVSVSVLTWFIRYSVH